MLSPLDAVARSASTSGEDLRRSMPAPAVRRRDDDRLVAAVREGDEAAFEAIYDAHAQPLLSYCRHMVGSRQEAEDALQQTFMKAYRAMRSTEKPIALRPWLYVIARNECISLLRRRDERSLHVEGVEVSSDGLAARVEHREELRAMLVDISRLPDDQREALILSGLGTLSGEEIGRILDCDRDRVKSLVFNARQALAKKRAARETSCAEIRSQLSVLRGGSLRRRVLREHLLMCEPCRDFRYEVRRQRQLVGALLPVLPAAGLKALCVPGAASAATVTALSAKAAIGTGGVTLSGGPGGVGVAVKAAGSVAGGSAAGLGVVALGKAGGAIGGKGALAAILGIVAALIGGADLGKQLPGAASDRSDGRVQVAGGGHPAAGGEILAGAEAVQTWPARRSATSAGRVGLYERRVVGAAMSASRRAGAAADQRRPGRRRHRAGVDPKREPGGGGRSRAEVDGRSSLAPQPALGNVTASPGASAAPPPGRAGSPPGGSAGPGRPGAAAPTRGGSSVAASRRSAGPPAHAARPPAQAGNRHGAPPGRGRRGS